MPVARRFHSRLFWTTCSLSLRLLTLTIGWTGCTAGHTSAGVATRNDAASGDAGTADDTASDAGHQHDAGDAGRAHQPSEPDASAKLDADVASNPALSSSTYFKVDVPNIVRRSNVVLGKANVAPKDAIALGNGTLGVATWAANGLTAQLNRADTFPDRKALGQLVIPGLAALTGAADFAGHVDLYDATFSATGAGIGVTAYVRADAPELIVEVSGAKPDTTQTAQLKLWSGRSPNAKASGSIATLSETWKDTGTGSSGESFGVLSGLTVDGRNVTASVVDALTVQVSFQPRADGTYRLIVAAPSFAGGDAMSAANAVLGSDATKSSDALRAPHLTFWHDYWSRVGLIQMTSTDGVANYLEALRTNYLYLTAAESRGMLPGSQAGLANLFAYLQDNQPWFPAGYWFWNTRMLVAANMSSGAFDMNASVWNLYRSNIANIQAWTASKMGGRPGLCVPETMRFNGNGYWFGGENDASCDEAASPNYNALTITSGAEVGLWIWQQYQMSGDRAFLTDNYPIMSGAAEFLLAYATTGSDGLLHTTANAHETQWNVQDPTTDLVAMLTLFPATISAANVLGIDADLVTRLQTALTKIPPLPRTDLATHMKLLTASDDAAGQDVFAISYQPSAQQHNAENLDLEAVWPYGLVGDTSPDLALAKRTYAHRMFVNNSDWNVDALQAARLGLASEVAKALTDSTKKYQSFANGLGLLSGGTADGKTEPYIEQAGVVTAALNEALVQDYDGLLRIAPAWPSTWDANGTVFIHGSSRVHVSVKAGAVVLVVIEAGSTGSLNVRNPWSGHAATVLNGSTAEVVLAAPDTATTFNIPVVVGQWYLLVPASAATSPPKIVVTGSPAVKAITLGDVRIGL
jgi:hypothetical protein